MVLMIAVVIAFLIFAGMAAIMAVLHSGTSRNRGDESWYRATEHGPSRGQRGG